MTDGPIQETGNGWEKVESEEEQSTSTSSSPIPPIEFKPYALYSGNAPPEIQYGDDYLRELIGSPVNSPNGVLTPFIKGYRQIFDAFKIGWVLKSPFGVEIDPVTTENTPDSDSEHPEDRDLREYIDGISITDRNAYKSFNYDEDANILKVDTHWRVKVPEGMQFLVLPFLNKEYENMVLPSVIDGETESNNEFSSIKIRLSVTDPVTIHHGDPLAQLLLVEDTAPAVTSRFTDANEFQEISENTAKHVQSTYRIDPDADPKGKEPEDREDERQLKWYNKRTKDIL